ncbi:hypothetical protein PGN35_019835 [Nodosilinea sp. PGN35]|nr:hypothetical protein [Nodosilinea sp. TSF1-S3]MDF0369767.1 hypothetical protein [Nodosilinea sp. TSF1-S3]
MLTSFKQGDRLYRNRLIIGDRRQPSRNAGRPLCDRISGLLALHRK